MKARPVQEILQKDYFEEGIHFHSLQILLKVYTLLRQNQREKWHKTKTKSKNQNKTKTKGKKKMKEST